MKKQALLIPYNKNIALDNRIVMAPMTRSRATNEENKPTEEYIRILQSQREWLYRFGTTTARGADILKVLSSYKK